MKPKKKKAKSVAKRFSDEDLDRILQEFSWFFVGGDQWEFGPMVRGRVKPSMAAVYFMTDGSPGNFGWVWRINFADSQLRGKQPCLWMAQHEAEQAVAGILDQGD